MADSKDFVKKANARNVVNVKMRVEQIFDIGYWRIKMIQLLLLIVISNEAIIV
jgi:hypothetical protein